MDKMGEKRFDSGEIIDKILKTVENSENVIKNTVKILKTVPYYTWIGIYLIEGDYLVLKYFLGRPTEHTRIKIGHGICGAAVVDEHTIIVPEVGIDDRYIACSAETKSEMVVPIWSGGRIIGEIDIDSDHLDAFDTDDKMMLERVADILGDVLA